MTKDELIGMIARHDTYYYMSDDPGVYKAGLRALNEIQKAAKTLGWEPSYLEYLIYK